MKEFEKELNNLYTDLKNLGLTFNGSFLSGGAITSTLTGKPVRDYDIYFKNREYFLDALAGMYLDGFWCVSVTNRAITFVHKSREQLVIQLMCFAFFETAQDIFNKFDFSCCMGALDLEHNQFYCDENFVRDISSRNLRFNYKTDFPLGSAMRVGKYKEKGYDIITSEYLKIILACSFKEINDWKTLKEQIGGQYGEAISLDTSREFSIENAINSLDNALIQTPSSLFESAGNFPEAVRKIFPEDAEEIIGSEKFKDVLFW